MAIISPSNLYNLLIKKWAGRAVKQAPGKELQNADYTETHSFLIRKSLNSTVELKAVLQAPLPGIR